MTSQKRNRRLPRQTRVINKQKRFRINTHAIALFSDAVLRYLSLRDHLGIALVTDSMIRKYNRSFLQHDRATDVIAFHYGPPQPGVREGDYLGDLLISVETAAYNAKRYNLSMVRELKNLVIHGILHLMGYDHVTDHGEMRALERKLRKKFLVKPKENRKIRK